MRSRREFLKGAALAGAGCLAAGGLRAEEKAVASGSPMHGFCAPRLEKVRLGIVGMGGRGCSAVRRLCNLPGVEVVAICDNVPEKVEKNSLILRKRGKRAPKEYVGEEEWRRLCEDPEVDVVYNTTPWALHVPVSLAAMRGGKHVLVEVPSAFTVDECWELVETSERTRRHCMQLENCCYGEIEMLTFNLAKLGMLGELVHAEGAYIHDLRTMCRAEWPASECWRFGENRDHGGNRYPTHGLVPLCLTFDVNRGDRLDYLVSMDSAKANLRAYMEAKLKPDNPRRGAAMAMADMNSSLVRTVGGRSILVQHDVVTPRPYSRIQFLSGTKGAISGFPYRVVLEKEVGSGAHKWFDDKQANEIREKYRHPLWKTIGELAKAVGGHGGMDFVMDARWVYCLQQGLPLDMDVYDLAATSCLCELTERSANSRSRPCDIPDFTRGAWKANKPMEVVDIDLAKFGINPVKPV